MLRNTNMIEQLRYRADDAPPHRPGGIDSEDYDRSIRLTETVCRCLDISGCGPQRLLHKSGKSPSIVYTER